ncbi:MAG: RagB/SusD family nutrient uptake outer membrane protein [Ferruginibacter sp.]
MNERSVELAFENKRWRDLVQTGKSNQVMKDFGTRIKASPQNYYFPPSMSPLPSSYQDIRLLFPIPASEVALNPYF